MIKKNCVICGKEFEDFSRSKTKIYCSRTCCKKVSDKKYYNKNKPILNIKQREYHKRVKQDFLLKYKISKNCVLCGYNEHPEILQFHHRNDKTKLFDINKIAVTKNKTEELEAEIMKCDLICPNCHFLIHFKEKEISNE